MRAATVRRFALSLPDAEERETWDTATFRVRSKIFIMFDEQERHLWIKSVFDEQQALITENPEAFFVPSWSTLPRVARQVDRLRAGAPIHVTETGYHTSYNRFHQYFVSEAQQAAWVDETMTAAAAQPRVSVVTWFNFQDNPRWTGGLLRIDGSRKPSYDRFAAAAAA